MSPVKNSWGVGVGGSKENLVGVKKSHEILQQISENFVGWPKIFKKMPFFGFKKI